MSEGQCQSGCNGLLLNRFRAAATVDDECCPVRRLSNPLAASGREQTSISVNSSGPVYSNSTGDLRIGVARDACTTTFSIDRVRRVTKYIEVH